MIKGDAQISDPAMNLPPIRLRKNLETNFSGEERRAETPLVEKVNGRVDVKIHFARLKRRMRRRSSSIF